MNNTVNDNPSIMGVLNITPDSFYSKSRSLDIVSLEREIHSMNQSDIIDIGAESSRPHAKPLTVSEELNRLDIIFDNMNLLSEKQLSIDTYKPEVAKKALENQFSIINDIFGGQNKDNLILASDFNAKIILMHIKGDPSTMQQNTHYDDLIDNIVSYFEHRVSKALEFGVDESSIILDPGIGFGKSLLDNYKIINNIERFKSLGFKVMIGLSRKSFLSVNNDKPEDRLSATICANTVALLKGADILRVHDVKEHVVIREVINNFLSNID